MRPTLPPLALLHEGDSFFLVLEAVGTKCVRICRITRYAGNQNASGSDESWSDLDLDTKRAIIRQINRRFEQKTILT